MRPLLAFIAMLGSMSSDVPGLKSIAENYLLNVNSVLIRTNQPNEWNDILLDVPVTVLRWTSDMNECVQGMILDLRAENLTENHIRPTRYDIKTVVVIEEDQEDLAVQSVHNVGLCQVILLTSNESYVRVTNITNACKGIGTEKLPKASDNCRANASYMDLPPNNLLQDGHLSGFEGKMLQATAEHMQIDLYLINQHETGYGQFSPPSGLQGDLSTGRSIAALGALYPFRARWLNAEMIFGCQTTSIAWSTPVGAGPTQPTWFVILVSELSPTVWILTLIVFAGLIPMSFVFDSPTRDNRLRPFHILALFLGVSQRPLFHKRFTLVIVFFGFIVSAYYQAMMSSKLTVPTKVPEITTLSELADSGLKLTGPPTHGKVMADVAGAAPQDSAKQKIISNFIETQATADETLETMVNSRDRAYLRHTFNLNYLSEKNPRTAGKIHIVEEAIAKFIPVTLTPKNSCLAPRIRDIYLRLCGNGLASKWLADFTAKRTVVSAQGPTMLTIDHIRGFLYLLILGWMMATAAFLCEKSAYFVMTKDKVRRVNADDLYNKFYH